jgi:hypothetical protein
MACFILGKDGFYKHVTFDKGTRTHGIKWAKSIRDAKIFSSSSSAKGVIEKHGLEAFIWNPYAETHIPAKWEAIFVKESSLNGNKSFVNMWQAYKRSAEIESDAKYLKEDFRNPKPVNELLFDTEQEALEKCIELNKILLQEMEIRMIAQKGQVMEIISEPYGI